jgi:hypothetical protein
LAGLKLKYHHFRIYRQYRGAERPPLLGTRACSTSAIVQRRRPEMIGTANWWRRYLWRANPPPWSVCHFRPHNAAQACRKLTNFLNGG